MKRSRAILLFSGLSFSILGYVAWCGRCFYLDQELEFGSEPPVEVRETFEEWRSMTHIDLTAELTSERFLEHLMHPGSTEDRSLKAWRMEGGGTGPTANLWMLSINRSSGTFTVLVNQEDPESPFQWRTVYSPAILSSNPEAAAALFDLTNVGVGTPLPADVVERAEEIMHTAR